MKFNEVKMRVLVRKDYGACFDFYKDIIGLVPVWGDRNGPYTSFATSIDEAPCFAIFDGRNMAMFDGYTQPVSDIQPDSVVAIIPSENIEEDYNKLKNLGVEFLSEPKTIEEWGMRCTYFRDPEGNLFELNDASTM
ncbi:VOC family protein [Anaerorhabdus sp.]|uniref:VOC family protein n=1 Tax=Anaerorhabdus sp. TaxID=1872524 RepID=UPI002FC874FD